MKIIYYNNDILSYTMQIRDIQLVFSIHEINKWQTRALCWLIRHESVVENNIAPKSVGADR